MATKKQKEELGQELMMIRSKMKKMAAREKELTSLFKEELPAGESSVFGSIVILLESKSRTNLDKAALIEELGLDKVKSFEYKSDFVSVKVSLKS